MRYNSGWLHPDLRHGRGSVMVWSCISGIDIEDLVRILGDRGSRVGSSSCNQKVAGSSPGSDSCNRAKVIFSTNVIKERETLLKTDGAVEQPRGSTRIENCKANI